MVTKVEISFFQKNRWDDDWEQYWFYAKIGFAGKQDSSKVFYPLASKVQPLDLTNQAEFRRSAQNYRECCAAFASFVRLIGERDLIEEFVYAKVWHHTPDWLPNDFFEDSS